ncbi:hypothetical protein PIROE2DRAFT_21642 [Piromyces sp. E2]|nr:hypothetical protein PIROE2DRAFT_21642 [Piromyces sp. E2]|eukprot:OUM56211.1 hypothetical protein PIROE2DRAFT_21642 [Piromyces sp. E2]
MKYAKYFSAVLFAGLLKVNALDCDTVKNILRSYYQIDDSANCCSYAVNDQYAVSCNGDAVTSLAIVNNLNIIEVPADVANLGNLESLDISNCNIQQFPSHLKALPKLKSLTLSKNAIGEVPEDVSQFPALEKLDLGENKLTALPATIGQLANLKVLNVYRNYLTALPESIVQLNLEKLNVESNQDLAGSFNFNGSAGFCNIKNTHLCIERKGVCNKYIVNNTRMPYCHPEQFTEEELDAGYDGNNAEVTTGNGGNTSTGGGSNKKTIIIIAAVAAVVIIAALAGLLIAKNRKKDKMQDPRLDNNYGRNPNYQQVNQNYCVNVPNGTPPNSYAVDIKPLVKH